MSDMPAVNVSGLKKVFNPGKPSQVDALVDGVFEDEEEQQLAYAAITAESLRLNRLVSDLLDLARLADMLTRVRGKIVHRHLDRISPLAVPVMLEIGREPVYGEAQDAILADAAARAYFSACSVHGYASWGSYYTNAFTTPSLTRRLGLAVAEGAKHAVEQDQRIAIIAARAVIIGGMMQAVMPDGGEEEGIPDRRVGADIGVGEG